MNLSPESYPAAGFYDEMLTDKDCRPHYSRFYNFVQRSSSSRLNELQQTTDHAQMAMGMTFNVYHENKGIEKILPLDIVPRIIAAEDWNYVDTGLKQRIKALNLFIHDVYNDRKILKDKIVPEELLHSSGNYLKPCEGMTPPKGIWCHISGSDIIRDNDGRFYVLEDNLRVPSGVSYILENREILKVFSCSVQ